MEIRMAKKMKKRKPNALQRFYRETVAELKKVTWPTREEAINLTRVVLLVIIAVSIFLGMVDFLVSRMFSLII
jgi:preprotein translocase subunit SecE